LILVELLHLGAFVGFSQFLLALCLLLSTCDKQLLAVDLGVVKLLDGGLRLLMPLKVDESESFALAFLVDLTSSSIKESPR
jgi:hypothetical protein